MKRLFLPSIFVLICLCSYAQNGNFIFLTSTGKLYSVNVDSNTDTFGVPKAITILPKTTPYKSPLSIALYNDSIYISETSGLLWSGFYDKAKLTVTMNKKPIYQFPNTKCYGLTVDDKGIIYSGNGSNIDIYNPSLSANNQPASISTINKKGTVWNCGGDLIFWGGELYETVENVKGTIQGLLKVNLKATTQDTLFSFNGNMKIFGISSVNVPCKNNQTFALSNDGNVYPIDLYKNTISDVPFKDRNNKTNSIVTYIGGTNFTIYDAASIAESGVAQRPTPPANPVTPNDICIGQPFTFSVGINDPTNDVLHWFTPPNIPPSNNNFSLTTPVVDVNKVGSTRYLITEFNNSNGCESDTVSIVVNVHPYPTKPVITASADTVCTSSASTLTITNASQTSGASYQWANAIGNVGTNSTTYSATATNAYAVKATAFGCSTASDSVKIKVLNSSITYSGNPFCSNGTASVTQVGDNEGGIYAANSADLIIDSKTGQLDLANSKLGNYTVTYTLNGTVYTCPYTTSVTINAISTSSNAASICQGGNYTFNGTTYTTAGTYTAKLTNSKGCDSIATLVLTVKQPSNSSTSASICPTGLPYRWNGQSYSAAGTYTVNLTNSVGCDSVATLVLSVKQPSSSSTSITVCPAGLPYGWNGQSYSAAGTYTVNLTNSVGCDSIATLVLSVTPTLTSTTNISVCSLPYTWNGLSYTTEGTYTFKLTSSKGCDSIATLVLALKAGSTSSTTVSICANAFPYTWNSQSYATAGTYTVNLTNSVGCDSIATLVLSVKQLSNSSTSASICPSGLPYSWNGQSYSAAGTYNVNLTNSVGCDSVATLVLSVNQPSSSSTSITVCPAGLPYGWNGQSYSAAGTYNVNLTNSVGCDSVATLVLSVTPTLTSTTNISVCSLPYTWNGQSYTTAGIYTITLNSSAGCDSIATLVLALKAGSTSSTSLSICANSFPYTWNSQSYATAGTYTVNLTNSAGCDSVATLVLSVQPKATVDAITGPTAVELTKTIDLDNNTTGGVWSITPTTIATIDNNGKVTGVASGTATVSYTIPTALCGSETAYHTITVSSQEVFIPNLFSPNGDKNGNDVFYIRGIGAAYSNVSLTIFDSWGNKVFDAPNGKLNDATVGWKGDYKNKPQPPGAYVYVVKLTLPSGGTVTKKGIINLIR